MPPKTLTPAAAILIGNDLIRSCLPGGSRRRSHELRRGDVTVTCGEAFKQSMIALSNQRLDS
jgi:hypothetical protein